MDIVTQEYASNEMDILLDDLHHNSSKYSPHIENQIWWKSSWEDEIFCWLTMFSNWYPKMDRKKENIYFWTL